MVNFYIGAIVDPAFTFIWVLMSVALLLGSFKAQNRDRMSFTFHVSCFLIIVISSVVLLLVFGTSFFYIQAISVMAFLTQITSFH